MKKLLWLTTAIALAACSSPQVEKQVEAKTDTPVVKQAEAKTEAAAQDEKPAVEIKETALGQGIYMLVGQGGNIGISAGDDGVFVIDDQFAQLAPAIIAKIDSLSDGSIRFVANTHYHGDHTGGNAAMADSGASIVAHDNVRVRMSQDQENKLWGRTTKATAPESWPTITFSKAMTFHFNGQTIDIVHVPSAHTDGDSIIYFREADVLHMGDNFFNGIFPYIDVDSGGKVTGMIAALDKGLSMAGPDTKIIPGHGPLSTPADMKTARNMLADIRFRVLSRVDSGESLETILNAKILSDYEEFASFINEENMVRITYRSLTGRLE